MSEKSLALVPWLLGGDLLVLRMSHLPSAFVGPVSFEPHQTVYASNEIYSGGGHRLHTISSTSERAGDLGQPRGQSTTCM